MATSALSEWIRLDQLIELLPISEPTARKLAKDGRIGTLSIPGARTLYCRRDAERLLAESTRPSKTVMESRPDSGVAVHA